MTRTAWRFPKRPTGLARASTSFSRSYWAPAAAAELRSMAAYTAVRTESRANGDTTPCRGCGQKSFRVPRVIAGGAAALAALERFEGRLARGLAQVINLLDPDVIVMGGGASQIPRLYQNVPARLKEYVFGREADTPILPAKHGDASGVRGAAWLWPL